MEKPISLSIIKQAFVALDEKIPRHLSLILGGGGAMIFAHGYPLATSDVDALPIEMSFEEIDAAVKAVAKELSLPPDWLNPYFSTFTYVLPADYKNRLIRVFTGKNLTVEALGREDMLIMKCFAHRPKDLGHARALIKAGADVGFVEGVIEQLHKKGVPEAARALDFLDELRAEFE